MSARSPSVGRGIAMRCLVSLLSLWTAACTVATQYPGGLNAVGTGCQSAASPWCSIVDRVLRGRAYNTTSAVSHRQCWQQCQAQARCSSVNYAYRGSDCQLNDATHKYTEDFSENSGWIYTYQRQQEGCSTKPRPMKPTNDATNNTFENHVNTSYLSMGGDGALNGSMENPLGFFIPIWDKEVDQSSTRWDHYSADKAADLDFWTSSETEVEKHPWWKVDLDDDFCLAVIKVVLPYGRNEFLGAVARAGIDSNYAANQACGSPASQEQREWTDNGWVVEFLCEPLRAARYVSLDIAPLDGDSLSFLRMEEVLVFHIPESQCDMASEPADGDNCDVNVDDYVRVNILLDDDQFYIWYDGQSISNGSVIQVTFDPAVNVTSVMLDVEPSTLNYQLEFQLQTEDQQEFVNPFIHEIHNGLLEPNIPFPDNVGRLTSVSIHFIIHEPITVNSLTFIGCYSDTWPTGTYGLPMPVYWCPAHSGFRWETGWRYQDTENTRSYNDWSPRLHLAPGLFSRNDMNQYFCMKTVERVGDHDVAWPNGQYCVFQYGDHCPHGMSNGSLYWDDEDDDNDNRVFGSLPSGQYDDNTLIRYCCMTSGSVYEPITLPTHSPFYLFPCIDMCQEVRGMDVTREWFYWDGEDSNNKNKVEGDHPFSEEYYEGRWLYYCYYYMY